MDGRTKNTGGIRDMVKKGKRMYSDRRENNGITEGCNFKCKYCAFEALQKRFGVTEEDRAYTPHTHIERVNKKPKFTSGDQFITIGLNGDISFASDEVIRLIIGYCVQWSDRTFLLQSKNPARFIETDEIGTPKFYFPSNVILACTLETNYSLIPSASVKGEYIPYNTISKAPDPALRAEAMVKIRDNRKIVTIEPILLFNLDVMLRWIKEISPEFIYIGYNSNIKLKLPEPSLSETTELIKSLKGNGFEVREKLIRKAFYE
ncbi:MAG: hypothetical protein PHW62_00340 [Candidatus Ratteibacteria bacterium]|nr:hypothetical protein [Candidatus Ratteibacteria bacterium]